MTEHPITPPPELVEQWIDKPFDTGAYRLELIIKDPLHGIATQAARWGADQELEACCELLKQEGVPAWLLLRLHRRTKPQSLKEQALRELVDVYSDEKIDDHVYNIIRRALEVLDD